MPKKEGALKVDPVPPAESDAKQAAEVTEPSTETQETEKVDKPETLLDAVRNAVSDEEVSAVLTTDTEKSDPEAGKETETETTDSEKKPEEETEPEPIPDDDPRLDKHPRFQQLIAERNDLKPRAEQYDLIERFRADNGLSVEEVARGFEIMAAMKNDPVRAAQMLGEHMHVLRAFTGEELPRDLAEKVDAGTIAEEDARELASRRAQEVFERERAQRTQAQFAQTQQAQQAQAHASTLSAAAIAWENSILTRDPDYLSKQPLILDRARSLIALEPPANAEAVAKLMDRAHKEVTDHMRKLIPKKPVTTQTSNGQSSNTAKPVPKTLAEAIRNA